MQKKVLLIVSLLLLCVAGFITADYVGLFGITEKPVYALQEVRIRPYDSRDNTPIEGVRIRCFQKGNKNACTQRDSHRLGIVSVMVPSIKLVSSSLLFEKGFRYMGTKDPNIQIMLIHADYVSTVESVEVATLLRLSGQLYRVKMEARGAILNNE